MKLGVCCPLSEAAVAKTIGFDYFECTFSGLAQMSDDEFRIFKETVDKLEFYPLAMNVMLTGDFRITGNEADHEKARPFLEKGFARAAEVKTQSVVFGSGRARNLPDGFTDRAKAYDQIVDFSILAGKIAGKNGIRIAVEPLSFSEANIINFVPEAAYIAERANLPGVSFLADYYHMAKNKESVSVIHTYGSQLEHCHISEPFKRTYPSPLDSHDYSLFINALKAVGYNKKVSIEASDKRGFAIAAKEAHDCLRPLMA